MEYTKEIYESEYGYGYKIFIDGKLNIIQPHAPGAPGLKGMTSSEANERADDLIERMSKPPEQAPESERMTENVRLAEEMMQAARMGDNDTFDQLRRNEPEPNPN